MDKKKLGRDCTHESHAEAVSTREGFLDSTVNHKPWVDLDYEVNMEQGDCPLCGSTLYWDFTNNDRSTEQ
jgi:hypothetical protein